MSQTLGYKELTPLRAPRHPYPTGKASQGGGLHHSSIHGSQGGRGRQGGVPRGTRQEEAPGISRQAEPPPCLEEALGGPAIAACPFPHTEPLLVLILQAAELQAGMKAQCDLGEHVCQLFLNQLVLG